MSQLSHYRDVSGSNVRQQLCEGTGGQPEVGWTRTGVYKEETHQVWSSRISFPQHTSVLIAEAGVTRLKQRLVAS